MSKPGQRASRAISIAEFYEEHGKELRLKLLSARVGFDRVIREPTINRPGLALTGFYDYFAGKRIQVLGNSEFAYLASLSPEDRLERLRALCSRKIPCIVVSRGKVPSADMIRIAQENGISVFQTPMITMRFINAATLALEWEFAPTSTEHGCMVDVKGIGILIRGASGLGKSESVLALLHRGYSLVADDLVVCRLLEGKDIVGTARELGQQHMEVRGLGIIDVMALFGVGAFRVEKRLDLVITLKIFQNAEELERVGRETKYYRILNAKIPHLILPVAAGRDMAGLIEVAALDWKLKDAGHNTPLEFNKKLLKLMRNRRIN